MATTLKLNTRADIYSLKIQERKERDLKITFNTAVLQKKKKNIELYFLGHLDIFLLLPGRQSKYLL